MKISLSARILLFTGCMVSFHLLSGSPTRPDAFTRFGIPDSLKSKVDSIVRENGFVNACRMTCRITAADGSVHYSGFDGRTQQAITQFQGTIDIGSCSKLFTATAILQLVEKGKLALDSKLTDLLPDRSLYAGLLVIEGKDLVEEVRLHHLLNHTSGFPDYFVKDDKLEMSIHGDSTLRFTPRQLLSLARRVNPPFHAPGGTFNYSNVNYILLGLIIERLSGMPYQKYIQKHILRPLGMQHTYFASLHSPKDRAPGHYLQDPSPMPATIAFSAGEMISTLDDMTTFIRAWHEGRLFVKPTTMTLLSKQYFNSMGGGIEYGLGVIRLLESYGHAGQTFGFSAYMGALPDGSSFVFGIDDAAVSAWLPAMEIARLMGNKQ